MVVEDAGAQTICRYCGKVMEFNKFERNAPIDKRSEISNFYFLTYRACIMSWPFSME